MNKKNQASKSCWSTLIEMKSMKIYLLLRKANIKIQISILQDKNLVIELGNARDCFPGMLEDKLLDLYLKLAHKSK